MIADFPGPTRQESGEFLRKNHEKEISAGAHFVDAGSSWWTVRRGDVRTGLEVDDPQGIVLALRNRPIRL